MTKPKKDTPHLKNYYYGIPHYQLANSGGKQRVPVRRKTQVTRSVNGRTNIAGIHAIAEKFAETHGVELKDVHISSNYSGYYIYTQALEPLKEYEAEVRRIENFNKALDAYRADYDALEKHRQALATASRAETEARMAKVRAEAERAARKALVRETQDKLRNDAKFMAALTDEVLSDDAFIRRLKALFSKGIS